MPGHVAVCKAKECIALVAGLSNHKMSFFLDKHKEEDLLMNDSNVSGCRV